MLTLKTSASVRWSAGFNCEGLVQRARGPAVDGRSWNFGATEFAIWALLTVAEEDFMAKSIAPTKTAITSKTAAIPCGRTCRRISIKLKALQLEATRLLASCNQPLVEGACCLVLKMSLQKSFDAAKNGVLILVQNCPPIFVKSHCFVWESRGGRSDGTPGTDETDFQLPSPGRHNKSSGRK